MDGNTLFPGRKPQGANDIPRDPVDGYTDGDSLMNAPFLSRNKLPVYKHRREFLYALSKHRVVIVCGQTGSGKTTQLPQYLMEAGYPKMIACTQPRRVAAISVAERVAEEVGNTFPVGGLVGYAVRFEEKTSEGVTKIKYLTDGMLFREAMFDPLFTRYSVIIIDEAHERSLYTDLLLGLLKKIMKKRNDLRLVISSATMDAELFKQYFAPYDPIIMSVQGRMYPVETFYLEEDPMDIIEETASTIIKIHKKLPIGDILVFLPGKDEIEKCITYLKEGYDFGGLLCLPLHALLPLGDQMRIFEPAPTGIRKVILATNIAETSVTIDGIVYIVDSGLVKQKLFNPATGLQLLVTTFISKASANQRAGRAGRLKAGMAFRLYTKDHFTKVMMRNSIPETQKCELSNIILQLKALGIDKILEFDFISPPASDCMARGLEFLHAVHAIDEYGRLSREVGVPMAELPLEPMLSRILLASGIFKCGSEAVTLAAMICAQPIFLNVSSGQGRALEEAKRKVSVCEGDLVSLVNIYRLYQQKGQAAASSWCKKHFISQKAIQKAIRVRSILAKYMERYNLGPLESTTSIVDFIKCIISGLFPHAAIAQLDGSYKTIREGVTLYIHPNSALFKRVPECVIFYEVMETSKVYMRDVTVVDPEWLAELAPNYYEFGKIRNG